MNGRGLRRIKQCRIGLLKASGTTNNVFMILHKIHRTTWYCCITGLKNKTQSKTAFMRIYLLLITLLITSASFSQMRPIDKVYIVEGVVADRETLQIIPSAILYNDSLGITTTSDDKGYFKLVVPFELIKKKQTIWIDIVKNGYKRNGSGFSYYLSKTDTFSHDTSGRLIWNYDVKIFWMAKAESQLSSNSGAYIRIKDGVYSPAAILETYNKAVASALRDRKMEQLKQGNEKVFFLIDGKAAMATASSDIYFDHAAPIVFISNKRVKLSEINNRLIRSKSEIDWHKSDTLSKQFKKDAIAFTFEN